MSRFFDDLLSIYVTKVRTIPPYPTMDATLYCTIHSLQKKKKKIFIRISIAEMANSLNQVITDSYIVFLFLFLTCVFVL